MTLAANRWGIRARWPQRGALLWALGAVFAGCGQDSIDLLREIPKGAVSERDAGGETGATDAGRPDVLPDVGARDSARADAPTPPAEAAAPNGCQSNDDCHFFLPRCDESTGACVECLSTPDCSLRGRFGLPVCDETSRRCVQCNQATDCGSRGDACADHRCTFHCENDDPCRWTRPPRVCDLGQGLCVECLTGADCAAFTGNFLRACRDNQCVECASDADCPAPGLTARCDTNINVCLCLSDADCRGDAVCSSAGVCVPPF